MPIDLSVLAALLIILAATVLIIREISKYKQKIKPTPAVMQQKQGSPLFEGIGFAINEMNKIGEEQHTICLKLGIKEEQAQQIVQPLRDRYNKLKWLKEHEGIAMPLIQFGQNTIGKILKGFVE